MGTERPQLCGVCKGVGKRRSETGAARGAYHALVTQGLHRKYGARGLHFITSSCAISGLSS